MLNIDPDPRRAELGFKDAVLIAFLFLESYRLAPVEEKITFVRYESPLIFVNVYHGQSSFELGFETGERDKPEDRFTLFEIIRWSGALESEGFGQHTTFQVSSREDVQRFVARLAELARKYAGPFLQGEPKVYESIKQVRSKWWADYVERSRLERVRDTAEAAWRQKDYGRVAALLSSIHDALSELEKGKLAYAEKHILQPPSGDATAQSGRKAP